LESLLLRDRRWIQCANVRRTLPDDALAVCPARCTLDEGDLVAGWIRLPEGLEELPILDFEGRVHALKRGGEAPLVIAPVGNSDSATHANGGVPPGGLMVERGRVLAWLAGESGLVGELFREASAPGGPASSFGVEWSAPFECAGTLVRVPTRGAAPRVLNIEELALVPQGEGLVTPILAIAGTSSELGKTTLACRVLRALVDAAPETGRPLRVAAVKPTGVGGWLDGARHREAGACIALDMVDAGLASSYSSEARFRERLLRPLLAAQQAGAELIVAELGGDLCAAHNPTWLASPEVRARLVGLAVLCSDNLAALGAAELLRGTFGAPAVVPPLFWFSSPFRNLRGMQRRATRLGPGEMLDPDDPAAIGRLAEIGRAAALASRPVGLRPAAALERP
jgi:hypothetical protein